MSPTRVILAEDSTLLREGLVGVLERFDFKVVAAVNDAERLITAVATHSPELVVTDIRMPPAFRDEGLRAALTLRRNDPTLPVVLLSQYIEQEHLPQLLAAGEHGLGYLLKDRVTDVRALIGAFITVATGGTVIDPEVVRRLLIRSRGPLDLLTDRERETLALMAQGRSNTAIAAEMYVSEATVAKHIRNVFDKLDLPEAETDNRRVLAVLTYLRQHPLALPLSDLTIDIKASTARTGQRRD